MPLVTARRFVVTLVAVVCGAGLLTGCSGSVPHLEEPTAGSSTGIAGEVLPSETTTPSASPTAEPTNDPATPDSWLITEDSIGPVKVGDNYDTLVDEISSSGVVPMDDAKCEGVAYGVAADNAYDILVRKDHAGEGVVEASIGWNGDTMGVGPRTAEGLGLGSTKAQVLGAYEDAVESDPSEPADHSYVTIRDIDGDSKLVFSFLDSYDGAVSVSVMTKEQGQPAYEPCA